MRPFVSVDNVYYFCDKKEQINSACLVTRGFLCGPHDQFVSQVRLAAAIRAHNNRPYVTRGKSELHPCKKSPIAFQYCFMNIIAFDFVSAKVSREKKKSDFRRRRQESVVGT